MTERRAPACHYDRTLGARVTREHRDDCETPVGHRGCAPCTAPHCSVCGHEHLSNDHPVTCPTCLGKVRDDLVTIPPAFTALTVEAMAGGRDGRLVAAAPIPGGTAAVLIGPFVRLDLMRTGSLAGMKTFTEDHQPSDPIPPLAVLAQWEDLWRTWLGHQHGPRATVASAIAYLAGQLGYMAQLSGPGVPDWVAFTRQIRVLRSRLEHALHDEQEPERGVECFECGDRLVRRFRDKRLCRHRTDARQHIAQLMADRPAALQRLAELEEMAGSEDRTVTVMELVEARRAARLPSPVEMAAARVPCSTCLSQGGLDDPGAGMSWECPGCRKEYKPGEYSTAVRLSLLEGGESGWTTLSNAAGAAQTITGRPFGDKTIRGWIGRGWVDSRRDPQPDGQPGPRLVFWPDVRQEALRMAAGRHHCAHVTPARTWLATLSTYPELTPAKAEIDDTRVECDLCAEQVQLGLRHVRGYIVA